MFTGIVERAGRVMQVREVAGSARLVVDAGFPAAEVRVGDSVAVNGCCLTAVEVAGAAVSFDVVQETLRRTSLGALQPGQRVNLERPLRADGRLDGHIVQGHLDGTANLVSCTAEGDSYRLRFQTVPELLRYVVEKGSIAVDGISLTVAGLGPDWFEVAIIPHTWRVTNLSDRQPGDRVNLEVDVLAKYVERLLGGLRCPSAA
jgi:riboflavin synthase